MSEQSTLVPVKLLRMLVLDVIAVPAFIFRIAGKIAYSASVIDQQNVTNLDPRVAAS